ncbi:MAG TPA: phosphopentomutase [Fimbriimonadaceae bacterium]|nr:phosphopentomutase [Fimbriimonadaceae bacterium]
MDSPRVIVIVLDGCGAGFAPDAPEFGDHDEPSTLRHTWDAVGGFTAPLLAATGYLAAGGVPGTPGLDGFSVTFGRLRELSKGKDSVTGHWEMMGIVTDPAFPTYPQGFPISLVKAFESAIGRQTLGNRPASGTQIIQELGPQHLDTGFPILYTSADSVFQIACHEEVVPIEQLYEFCTIARALCAKPNDVSRVIARPFLGTAAEGFVRTERRKDFPLEPPFNFVDAVGDVLGLGVVPELFAGRGFRHVRRTQSNAEHEAALREALGSDARFIFANFEDFDMLYGHRNDPAGFARCLERFEQTLAETLSQLRPSDLLVLTADHGNDPTTPSTDHSREYVPVSAIARGVGVSSVGDLDGFSVVGRTVAHRLGLAWPKTLDASSRSIL